MADTIIDSIQSAVIRSDNVCFDLLRHVAGRDVGSFYNLDRGRAVLSSEDELDQYLYSYGLMIKSQWVDFLPAVPINSEKVRIIDYGCGQGLASAFLFDYVGRGATSAVTEGILIEPSAVALARAQAIFQCYCQSAVVKGVNKYLDQVTLQDLGNAVDAHTFHLLSNILDIGTFDHIALFRKILQIKGKHTVLVVSHDRNHNGGAGRIFDLNYLVFDLQYRGININKSDLVRFRSTSEYDAISWQLHFEV